MAQRFTIRTDASGTWLNQLCGRWGGLRCVAFDLSWDTRPYDKPIAPAVVQTWPREALLTPSLVARKHLAGVPIYNHTPSCGSLGTLTESYI